METKIETINKLNIIRPAGEIDLNNSPKFRQILQDVLETANVNMAIDLSGVSYMDSSGLATLVEALQKTKKLGRRLVIFSLTAPVKNIFSISRLDEVFPIFATETEALKEFNK